MTATVAAVAVTVSPCVLIDGTVSCGSRHSLVLTDTGRLFSFGWNGKGQLGVGSLHTQMVPCPVTFPLPRTETDVITVVTAMCAGYRHSLAATVTVSASGSGDSGRGSGQRRRQVLRGSLEMGYSWVDVGGDDEPVTRLDNIVGDTLNRSVSKLSLHSNSRSSSALSNGVRKCWAWGWNEVCGWCVCTC